MTAGRGVSPYSVACSISCPTTSPASTVLDLTDSQRLYIETRKAVQQANREEAAKAELEALWKEYEANDWLGDADRALIEAKHRERCRLWREIAAAEAERSLGELEA